jgi:hypothetical protein
LGREIEGVVSPELDFAQLETLVAQWLEATEAKQTADSNRFRDQAIQAVKLIEQTHGPYWGRRAEMVLVSAGGTRSGGSLEILRRAADDYFLKGQIEEALATYDKAAAAAREARDSPSAFEMAYKAALVQQQQTRHIDAAQRFRQLALAQQTHPQAASAHLLAVFNEAQAWKADVTRRDQYLARLKEHLDNWPYSATSNAARLWLGRLHENEQSWQLAVEAYRAVSRNSEYFAEATQRAERCLKNREQEKSRESTEPR